jgi:hypothetical protein
MEALLMTEENRFFRFVWRFNGLVIMIAGVLAIGVLAFTGYSIFQDVTSDREARNILNVQEENDIKESWQLGYMTRIDGSPYVMIPLYSDQDDNESSYSKSSTSARNYLFINSQDNTKNWLFKTNKYVITDTELLSEKDYDAADRKVRAILFRIIKADSNNDQRLTDDDLQSFGLSMPDGLGYTEILSDIDLFVGSRLIDEETLLIVFQRSGIGYSANIDLNGFVISHEAELPKVGH